MLARPMKLSILAAVVLLHSTQANAKMADTISVDTQNLSNLPLRSEATAKWLFIDVYNASLYAPPQTNRQSILDEQTPLKLKLCYLHKISKEELIEAASKALPEKLDESLQQAVNGLHQAYQKVQPQDCYQLSYSQRQGVVLSFNDKPIYQTKTAGFKQLYFGIWLGKEPLSKTVKEELLKPL